MKTSLRRSRFLKSYHKIVKILLPLRVIVGILVVYKFVIFSADTKVTKGGTVVEGVLGDVSYVPYLTNNTHTKFYTSLLFDSCLDYTIQSGLILFTGGICNIKTNDNKTYTVRLQTGHKWQDNEPMTINDIFFTYKYILSDNKRHLPQLNTYVNTKITQAEDVITITFPFANKDNRAFFLNYILPQHILQKASFQEYKNYFATNPVNSTCAQLSKAEDTNSLIFDLGSCSDTKLGYYQLKYLNNQEELISQSYNNPDFTIDIYQNSQSLPNYKRYNTISHNYVTVFFNTQSDRLSKRIQRSLGGLIVNNLYSGSYYNYLHKEHLLLDTFLSKGEAIKENILNHNPNLDIEKKDLTNIGTQQLPKKISCSGETQKFVYYIEPNSNKKTTITRQAPFTDYEKKKPKKYTKFTLQNPHSTGESTISLTPGKPFTLTISTGIIKEGLNKYRIKGYYNHTEKKGKKSITTAKSTNIIDLDIYYFRSISAYSGEIAPHKRIKLIYFKDTIGSYIATRLQELFHDKHIGEFFFFIGYDNIQDFENKILAKDYDIVIRPLYFGYHQDISSIFLTDNPQVNPSLYKDVHLAELINKYIQTDGPQRKQDFLNKAKNIYANAMPLVILGQIVEPIYLHNTLSIYPFGVQDAYNWKKYIYHHLELVKHFQPNWNKFTSGSIIENFWAKQRR